MKNFMLISVVAMAITTVSMVGAASVGSSEDSNSQFVQGLQNLSSSISSWTNRTVSAAKEADVPLFTPIVVMGAKGFNASSHAGISGLTALAKQGHLQSDQARHILEPMAKGASDFLKILADYAQVFPQAVYEIIVIQGSQIVGAIREKLDNIKS